MRVRNEIRVYEVDGKEIAYTPERFIAIESHWNQENMIVFKSQDRDGKMIALTLVADDLLKAIKNATNWD